MITKNYEYSLKNIPSPSKDAYLKCLINKTEHFIKRMRWKAFFFEKELRKQENGSNEDDEDTPNNFGFKTQKTPPKSVHLKQFEDEMYTLIQQIEFDNRRNDFQQKLKRDCIDIRSSGKLLVPADKSSNLYEMDVDQYNKLLSEKVTKSYRKTNTNAKNYIDLEAKSIATSLGLSDRIQCLSEKDAFITLKDHKENFTSKPSCRLINPAKSEIGHISKSMLERIVSEVTTEAKLNQWRNTAAVIEWFKSIPNNPRSSFIKFDICDFYPSITEQLLDRAIDFAKSTTNISDTELKIIKHARKSLLFSGDAEWMKKNGDLFDVTMGSYDGAEVCELVGCISSGSLVQS